MNCFIKQSEHSLLKHRLLYKFVFFYSVQTNKIYSYKIRYENRIVKNESKSQKNVMIDRCYMMDFLQHSEYISMKFL